MKTFEIKAEHIKLLRAAYVSWEYCEFGAPAIDCKRPYGNSNVLGDMAEILNIEVFVDRYGEKHITEEQETYLTKLHEETLTALQIFLTTGEMKTGKYESSDYGIDWKYIGETK